MANPSVSYFLYFLVSLLLAGWILVPFYMDSEADRFSIGPLFISGLFLYDYFFVQVRLQNTSLIDKSAFSLFPVSHTRSLSYRFLLFLVEKRIFFYLLPMLGMMIALLSRGKIIEGSVTLFLFTSTYLVMSEVFFSIYLLLRRIADRFSVRTATQIATIPFVLMAFLTNSLNGRSRFVAMMPVVSQFTKCFLAILSSDIKAASMQVSYLLVFFISVALAMTILGFMFDKLAFRNPLLFARRCGKELLERSVSLSVDPHKREGVIEKIEASSIPAEKMLAKEDPPTSKHVGWHLVLVDWLVHQREEKILYLLLLYPLMAIFVIVRMISRLHFEPGSLIIPIFLLTQILGFYFTENHFTGHGLRLSHTVLTPLNPYRLVLAKTISTWGLLSLMNVFVCVFCGVYLNMSIYVLGQGTIYSLLLPLLLLQLANTLSLYFPRISRHPLISLFLIVIPELILTAVYILVAFLNFFAGVFFASAIFILSYTVSLPAWGRQLSNQLQTLLE